jgi:hypothetical protein
MALHAILIALVALAGLVTPAASPAHAHEGREVGPYRLILGWRVEPAYVGVYNGPELTIQLKEDASKRVTGAEQTLTLEVRFGDQSRALRLEAVPSNAGHYTADLIPTRAGDYTFVVNGKIGDTEVNEVFTSADGEFSTVEPAGDILFPDDRADLISLQRQIDALRAEIEALKAKLGS